MPRHPARTNKFECPLGCKAAGKYPVSHSLNGWKRHMSVNHGGFTEDQLRVVVGLSPAANSAAGRDKFLGEVDKDSSLFIKSDGQVTDAPPPGEEPQKTVEIKTDAVSKKFSAKLNNMKKGLAEKAPKILAAAVKDKGPDWELSDEDNEIIQESVENVFEILDVNFQVAPLGVTLQNPLWVLLIPFLALIIVFAPKATAAARHERERKAASEPAEEMAGSRT